MASVMIRRGLAAGRVLILLAAAGCGGGQGYERYVPAPGDARQALEASLKAWQEGRPAGRVEGGPVSVYLVDTCRQPGQRLRGYSVLGERPGDGPRCFVVRLQLDDPPEEQRVRYLVFGIDPLWVYRYEDYEMMIHWECGTEDARPGQAGRSPVEK